MVLFAQYAGVGAGLMLLCELSVTGPAALILVGLMATSSGRGRHPGYWVALGSIWRTVLAGAGLSAPKRRQWRILGAAATALAAVIFVGAFLAWRPEPTGPDLTVSAWNSTNASYLGGTVRGIAVIRTWTSKPTCGDK